MRTASRRSYLKLAYVVGLVVIALILRDANIDRRHPRQVEIGVEPQVASILVDHPASSVAPAKSSERLDSEVGRAESLIEALSPTKFSHYSNEYLTFTEVYGANFEPVEGGDLFLHDSGYLLDYLSKYSDILGYSDGIQIEIIDSRISNGEFVVEFRQILHGIPVAAHGQLRYTESGQVVALKSWIIDPNAVHASPTILRQEAISHAVHALDLEISGDQMGPADFLSQYSHGRVESSEMEYSVVGPLNRGPIPVWNIELTDRENEGVYHAIVNAMSGETQVT